MIQCMRITYIYGYANSYNQEVTNNSTTTMSIFSNNLKKDGDLSTHECNTIIVAITTNENEYSNTS